MQTWLGLVAAGLLLIATGATLSLIDGDHAAAGRAVPVVDVGTLPVATRQPPAHPADDASARRSSPPARRRTARGARPPVADRRGTITAGSRLRIAALGVDAPILRASVECRVMQVPLDPRDVGWWTGGRAPGDPHGTTVLVGHVDYAGVAGALGTLPNARPGEVVAVAEPSTTARYRIVAVRTYPKTSGLPDDLFDTAGAPRLVLITCGGPFDPSTGNYLDNIVAYAVPA